MYFNLLQKHPRQRLMLAEVPEVMQCCEERGEQGEHLITYLRGNREHGEQGQSSPDPFSDG